MLFVHNHTPQTTNYILNGFSHNRLHCIVMNLIIISLSPAIELHIISVHDCFLRMRYFIKAILLFYVNTDNIYIATN